MKLKQTKQCKTCPWIKDADPFDIPNGYSVELHKKLECTISDGSPFTRTNIMACHHSPVGDERHCLGWLMNQLGPGNNIGLRIQMMKCENLNEIELIGEQHDCFEETLP